MIGTTQGLITYAAARGISITVDEAPILLTKATDYMNTFNWVGTLPDGQEDSWPRTTIEYTGVALVDGDGNAVTSIEDDQGVTYPLEYGDIVDTPPVTPKPIIIATYRVASVIGEGTEVQEVTNGGKIKQERVEGAVTVIYADGTESDPLVIPGFEVMVSEWLLSPLSGGLNFSVRRG